MTELEIKIPLSATRHNYDPEVERARYASNRLLIKEKYSFDKFIGKRKNTGEKKLKKLSSEHLQWIAAYINGMTGVQIAEAYDKAAITVYRVLKDPLSRKIIDEFNESARDEFNQMFPLVADAIRVGLEHPSVTIQLKAVDRWAKLSGAVEGAKERPESRAEVISLARIKVVRMLEAAVKATNVIEAEAIVVDST